MKEGPTSLAEIREVLKEFYGDADNYQPQIFEYCDRCHQSGSPNVNKRDLDSVALLFKGIVNQDEFPFKAPLIISF